MAARDTIAELIERTLRLSEDEVNNLFLDQGVRYVRLYMPDDARGQDMLLALPEYWAWWRRTWRQVDRRLVSEQHLGDPAYVVDAWARAQLVSLWRLRHDAGCLGLTPSRYVHRRLEAAKASHR